MIKPKTPPRGGAALWGRLAAPSSGSASRCARAVRVRVYVVVGVRAVVLSKGARHEQANQTEPHVRGFYTVAKLSLSYSNAYIRCAYSSLSYVRARGCLGQVIIIVTAAKRCRQTAASTTPGTAAAMSRGQRDLGRGAPGTPGAVSHVMGAA